MKTFEEYVQGIDTKYWAKLTPLEIAEQVWHDARREFTKQFTAHERVARGVKTLNDYFGDNSWRILLKYFINITSLNRCVLSQVFGQYSVGCSKLSLISKENEQLSCGFDNYSLNENERDELNDVWNKEIFGSVNGKIGE
jgi:hypothetical protein